MILPKIKRLLIGLAILLAGVVIVLPFFYVHHSIVNIPTQHIEHLPVPADPESWQVKPLIPFQQDISDSPSTEAMETTGWVVEVLHPPKLSQQVVDLVRTLRENGFQAYMEGNSNARVLIGPVLKKARADVISTRLYEEFNLKSTVVPFEPIQALTEIKERTL